MLDKHVHDRVVFPQFTLPATYMGMSLPLDQRSGRLHCYVEDHGLCFYFEPRNPRGAICNLHKAFQVAFEEQQFLDSNVILSNADHRKWKELCQYAKASYDRYVHIVFRRNPYEDRQVVGVFKKLRDALDEVQNWVDEEAWVDTQRIQGEMMKGGYWK